MPLPPCLLRSLQRDLIDTQWNVNTTEEATEEETETDLIDTQWNVNVIFFSTRFVQVIDLIDTQWNVNQGQD